MKAAIFILFYLISQPLLAEPDFVHCYDFACKSRQEINYSPAHWDDIMAIFTRNDLDKA